MVVDNNINLKMIHSSVARAASVRRIIIVVYY